MGYLDEEGYLYICGRKKSMINVRGCKVYPEDLEACMHNSGLARDCRVYGRTGALGTELVCMEVVPLHSVVTAEAIRAYCAVYLADYKQPRVIALCEEIPRSPRGENQTNCRAAAMSLLYFRGHPEVFAAHAFQFDRAQRNAAAVNARICSDREL